MADGTIHIYDAVVEFAAIGGFQLAALLGVEFRCQQQVRLIVQHDVVRDRQERPEMLAGCAEAGREKPALPFHRRIGIGHIGQIQNRNAIEI